jgi:hypothetical protein
MRVLVARWATDGNATLQPPALLWWNDGTPATLDHYEHHLSDTHSWVIMPPTGIERRTFSGYCGRTPPVTMIAASLSTDVVVPRIGASMVWLKAPPCFEDRLVISHRSRLA